MCRRSRRLSVLSMLLVVASALVTTLILEFLGIIGGVGVVLIGTAVLLIVHLFGVFFGVMLSFLTVGEVHTY